jgi:hypothetical protein
MLLLLLLLLLAPEQWAQCHRTTYHPVRRQQ